MKKGIKTKNIHSKYIAVVPNGGTVIIKKQNKKALKNFIKNIQNLKIILSYYAGTFGRINNLKYVIKLAKKLKKILNQILIFFLLEMGLK